MAFLQRLKAGRTYDDFLSDPLRQHAVIRAIEIIGEAAKNISDPLKDRYPNVPWRLLAGTRDRLIHACFDVDWRIVWTILADEIPLLEQETKAILTGMSSVLD